MKIGTCATIDHIERIKETGFDYIELPVTSFARLNENDFRLVRNKLRNSNFPCLGANFFFPSDLKLVGNDVEESRVKEYCKIAVNRCLELGAIEITVGSGKARFCPEGFSKITAVQQFGAWLEYASQFLANTDCRLCIEPIRHQSTNILNTLAECRQLCISLDNDRIKQMVDFQQLRCQGDSLEEIINSGPLLIHAHISNSVTLQCPIYRNEDLYETFFLNLKAIGYKGNISVETIDYGPTLSPKLLACLCNEYGFIKG